ncbi:hypothetical protein O6H91_22G066500 [Diphasiastrum complanatum]|uniref:Uncharacterized protein n=1 Tax=Diphasiastrum complanatum TaxID=34168 RepID=A0ACC2AGH0_DIPCM|nr:hypothetical protein O6H91_Y413300 [Diphasiastrum complanatum]KAJ7257261.1 hypothetical protein O6H91_Y413300 [Diphasiastrum complanatum]KAJ7516658.1 hypothetical protein O6H91_22G066500 [Diphasiastrum complanatum]
MISVKSEGSSWRWALGVFYVVLVAIIWIAASFVVQSVIDSGVSPFLISYIANSLFIVYIPIVEIGNLLRVYLQKPLEQIKGSAHEEQGHSEEETLLSDIVLNSTADVNGSGSSYTKKNEFQHQMGTETSRSEDCTGEGDSVRLVQDNAEYEGLNSVESVASSDKTVEVKRVWTRKETARIGLIICPIWFMAQFTFNLSLKYTTVTSNTILSSTSSLFTFMTSVSLLGEKFTAVKLVSVLLCMAGTIFVGLGDSERQKDIVAPHPVWGDILCLVSALLYAAYTTLIRKKFPDDSEGKEEVSTALFLGFVGLFNALLFLPFVLLLHFTNVERLHKLSPTQLGLIIGKGLLDNVLSDYLWAKAVLLTTPTVATAGLTLQVPISAIVDSIRGNIPSTLNILGAVSILVGFFGINQPATGCCTSSSSESSEDDVIKSSSISDAPPLESAS